MMPRRTVSKTKDKQTPAVPAVILLFPEKKREAPEVSAPGATKQAAASSDAKIPQTPALGERPTLLTPRIREWLKYAAIASVVLHVAFVAAFYLRNEEDLARASGAAASASSDGAIIMEVDVVVNAPMPTAAKQTNFTKDAKQVTNTPPQERAEPKPQPKQEVAKVEAAKEAEKPALAQDELAPPKPAETAPVSEAPKVVEEKPEEPKQKEIAKDKTAKAEQKTVDAAPTAAANPNRSASSGAQGRAGAGGREDAGGRAAISSYQAQVLAHLQRHRVYPSEAQSRGITGVARVRFSLASNGSVISASLAGSSGTSVLDQAAIAMVRRASPFPAFPSGIQRAQLDFAAPIRFDIR